MQGSVGISGAASHRLLKGGSYSAVPPKVLSLWEILRYGFPHFGLSKEVALWRFKNIPNLWRGLWRVLLARFFGIPHFYGTLSHALIRANGDVVDYGIASFRLVTTAGVNFITDAFQNTAAVEDLHFHGWGTGTNAENASNTTLQTELTTEYVTNSTRPTGSTTEGASANIFRTVGTLSPDSGGTLAITEHGVFSATSAGTLLDRSVFSAINLTAGTDSLTSTYDITFATGS
jgi:hypothetical protein